MKLIFVFLLLIPILLELASAAPVSTLDPYGRVYRNSRMSSKNRVPVVENDADDEDEEDDDDDADDDADDDSFYPPDFEKLFPNPDGKPVGPNSHSQYEAHHPMHKQAGRPAHGPASNPGPAAMRGPVPQHSPKPHERGSYSSGPSPQRDAPPRRYSSRPPPQHDGPPPGYNSRPQYRTELIGYLQEPESSDEVSSSENARQLFIPVANRQQGGYIASNNQRQVPLIYRPGNRLGYQNRRVVSYPVLTNYGNRRGYYPYQQVYYPNQNRRQAYPLLGNRYTTVNRYPVGNRRQGYYPKNSIQVSPVSLRIPTPVVRGRVDTDDSTEVNNAPVVPDPRLSRIYTPWARNPLRGDSYNPEYVVNPTEMISRRRFRYHPSQRIPVQRIPLYSGHWGNPRNSFYDPWTKSSYHGSFASSQI